MNRIIASYFGSDPKWLRLSAVLRSTAKTHCPDWVAQIDQITPAAYKSALNRQSYVDNTQKMEHWAQAVASAADGDALLLIDSDAAILQPIDPILDLDFDVAYTTKDSRFPFNSGVVFLRVNPRSRAFIATWFSENMRLLRDRVEHKRWRLQFGGINQAALGSALFKSIDSDLNLLGIPCVEWNCEDASWEAYDPALTRILHVKGNLRRVIFDRHRANNPAISQLAKLWKTLDKEVSAE